MLSTVLLLPLLTAAPALQEPAPPTVVEVAPAIPEQYPDYEIGPGDIVKIAVSGHDDLTQTVILQSDGTFIYPLIGSVKASDMTSMELAQKIGKLLANGYIRDPQVTVIVEEYRSKKVLVIGQVSKPGSYPLAGNVHIMEVLAQAGASSDASPEVIIIRPRDAAPLRQEEISAQVEAAEGGTGDAAPGFERRAEMIRVDLQAIQAGDLDKNIPLLPHDTVYVPPAPKFFISGEVANRGAYTLPPDTTVREAVILAGGFTPSASENKIRVIRRVDGEEKEIKVHLEDLVQPGDFIVVKASLF